MYEKLTITPSCLAIGKVQTSRNYVGFHRRFWLARYFVPDDLGDYCMRSLSAREVGFGAMVSGAGGL
jgi:hypothetical protein